jgi:xylan 1,4-beta-xylosidase
MRSAKVQLELDKQLPPRPRGWSNPVVPGDHPDPTIIRVGRTFWASATSGEWSPQFPLFRSTDLVHWEPEGAIFYEQPTWAEGSFWAPELVHDETSGRFLAWYVARKRGGPLCVAVASAPAPGGPYTDHGPLICQEDGSIDPCFARDEHGEPYLIWKEDGNSVGRHTPIWAQALSDDLLHVKGEKTQLITNDQPWEAGVVEGEYIMRHLDADGILRFYMFYAGNSCCGLQCEYAEGVARSEKLLGPWEKCPRNPLISANDHWRCPGHGTVVHTAGTKNKPEQDYLLYHAYPSGGTIYIGREAVLDEISWPTETVDGVPGWPSINAGAGPGEPAPAPLIDFFDDFSTVRLGHPWQWPVNTRPQVSAGRGWLHLGIQTESPLSDRPVESAILAVPRPGSLHYQATVTLRRPHLPNDRLWAGLSVIGDPFNTVGLGLRGTNLILWERRGATQREITRIPAPEAPHLILRSASFGAEHHLHFSYSTDGETFHNIGEAYDASDLPAWDRGLRIGLMLEGPQGSSAGFAHFVLRAQG